MKTNFKWIYSLFLALLVQFSFAQEKTITGVVIESGQPLPGVTIVVKGTSNGTETDFDGKYSITAKKGDVIEFSYIGLKSQLITVGDQSIVNITMEEDVETLEGVVVTAYGTTTKVRSNIASTSVSSKTIETRPNASFIQTLQAQVPGLSISSGSGQPGANSTVILRGIGSINGKVEPLFVIDGVPLDSDSFRNINPNDIESVTVLKDAGATSIYGNRGANGVIVVYTKKGTFEQNMTSKYTVTTGYTSLQGNDYRFMNAKQHLQLQKDNGVGRGATLSDEEIAAYNVDTDWLDVFFRTGVSQNHVLSFTSGSKNLSSFTSISYFNQEGILINTDLNRFTFRNNLNGKSNNGKFTYGTNFTATYSKSNEAPNLGTGAVNRNYVLGASNSARFVSPDDYENGQQLLSLYQADGTLLYTPLFLLDQSSQYSNRRDEFKLLTSGQMKYQITNELSVGSTIGIDYTHTSFNTYESPTQFNAYLFLGAGQEFGGFQDFSSARNFGANTNFRINYNKIIAAKHSIDVSLFTEYYKAHFMSFNFRQSGLNPKQASPGAGTGFVPFNPATPNFYRPTVGASKIDAGLFSYFGQADYDYDSKYGFGLTLRRDASYRFANTNRWGTYWSVSGRWNLDKEAFMSGSIFDVLKVRASYGTAGNQNILGESIFNATNLSRTLYGTGAAYAASSGVGLAQLGNSDLKWETVSQANIGADFEVLNRSLRGSVDIYQKQTDDMYLSVPISSIYGQAAINANNGTMRNSGVELLLAYDLLRETDFKLTLNFNGSYNKNEVISLPDGDIVDTNSIISEGRLLNEWYLIPYAGVNPANGNLLFYDIDGNVTENPNPDTDRRFTGKTSTVPVYQGGFGFDASYKGFFLNTLFSYVADIYRLDFDLSGAQDVTANNFAQFNVSTDLLNAWTPENPITSMPAINAFNANTYVDTSDRYLRDASFIRLRFVTFGYNFTPEVLKKTPFKNVRAFAQAENLFTWTKWRGWDAESPRGGDQYQYPTPRIVSLGLEIQF
uniref:SusC/RagA family TonB-linked outer membrane protein n=2 Tax=Flavobacterium sp. TaxID=239 RepID=UPI00404A0E79